MDRNKKPFGKKPSSKNSFGKKPGTENDSSSDRVSIPLPEDIALGLINKDPNAAQGLIEYLRELQFPIKSFEASLEELDRGLLEAIRAISAALKNAGKYPGNLYLRGDIRENLSEKLGPTITFLHDELPRFLVLGLTMDFHRFSYQPHCRLFEIISALVLIDIDEEYGIKIPAEHNDPQKSPADRELIVQQLARPLLDAHMMRTWLKYVRPTGKAVAAGDNNALRVIFKSMRSELVKTCENSPNWMGKYTNIKDCYAEWASKLPGVQTSVLMPDAKSLNFLPMTDFIHGLVVKVLASSITEGIVASKRA